MTEQDDPEFDATLRAFFHDALDGRRGGAEQAFRRHVKAEARGAWRTRGLLIGAFASGLAASVAVLWATPMFHAAESSRPVVASGSGGGDAALAGGGMVPVMERVVNSRTSDEGVMMLDEETPVRVYRRQAVERTRWFDENDSVRRQEVTPRDDLVLMKLTTY